MKTYNTLDKEADRKAKIATGITALLLLIAFIFITFSVDAKQEDEKEEGILVNFGTSNVGSGRIQPQQKAPSPIISPPKQEQKQATTTPPKAQPKPKTTQKPVVKQKEVITQKEPSKVITKPKQIAEPKKEVSTQNNDSKKEVKSDNQNTSNTPSQPTTPVAKPAPKQPERTYGGKSNVPSAGEGNDSQAGDKGQIDGSPNKGAYEGTNSGLGDSGVGYNLSGRKLVQPPTVTDNTNIEGKVTVNIKVDQNGKVITASLGKPTTISNNALIQKSIQAARRAKFDANKSASEEQFGTMTFVYKVR